MGIDASVVTFRPLAVDDLPRLWAWLARPHVAEWWGDAPATLPELAAEYAEVLAGAASQQAFLAEVRGTPIGFIQAYQAVACHAEGWWRDEHAPGVRGIDQFLAEAEQLGQGLGTAMVRAFVGRLFADPAVTRVQTDPDPSNRRAIRCYAKAGFRSVGEVDTPDGRALLMYADRPGIGGGLQLPQSPVGGATAGRASHGETQLHGDANLAAGARPAAHVRLRTHGHVRDRVRRAAPPRAPHGRTPPNGARASPGHSAGASPTPDGAG